MQVIMLVGDDYVYSAQKGGYIKASGQYDKDFVEISFIHILAVTV